MKILETIINWFKPEPESLKLLKAINAEQVAKESYDYWTSVGASPVQAYALLGNEEGETSFNYRAIGDRGEAYGPFQWHKARRDLMLKGCGIDVTTASHVDQLKAAHWEMTSGSYKRVWPKLIAAQTIEDAVTVLVHDYEQSGSQARDILRRTNLAVKWQKYFEALTPKLGETDHKLGLRIAPVSYTKEEFTDFVNKLDLKKLKWKPQFVTLHNTATPTLKQWIGYGPALQKRWPTNLNQYYSNLGWHSSVHLVATPDAIWNLCNLLEDGIHASCFNKVAYGLEMVGSYDTEEFDSGPGLQVQENAIHIIAVLCNKFGWNPSDYVYGVKGLHFHKECVRDHHNCPGPKVDKAKLLVKIQNKMKELAAAKTA